MPLPEKTFDLSPGEATRLRDKVVSADLAAGTVGADNAAPTPAGADPAAGGAALPSGAAEAETRPGNDPDAAPGEGRGDSDAGPQPRAAEPAEPQQDPAVAGTMPADYSRPNTLYIPSLGVQAPLEPETAQAGALVIPGNPHTVAWYSGSPAISDTAGTTLLAGHVNYESTQGALYPLSTITPGALIIVTDAAGNASRWLTVSLQVRDKDDLPVFPATGPRRLALVTCGGALLETERGRSYESNVIAEAIPA